MYYQHHRMLRDFRSGNRRLGSTRARSTFGLPTTDDPALWPDLCVQNVKMYVYVLLEKKPT